GQAIFVKGDCDSGQSILYRIDSDGVIVINEGNTRHSNGHSGSSADQFQVGSVECINDLEFRGCDVITAGMGTDQGNTGLDCPGDGVTCLEAGCIVNALAGAEGRTLGVDIDIGQPTSSFRIGHG